MIANDPFERLVSDWLHADAEHRVPDHLESVLLLTSGARQRPAWSSLERWLPLDTTFHPRLLNTPSIGRVLAVAALILILVAVAAFAIGSQHRLPQPFGPATNGLLLTSADGDIYAVDPVTLARHPVVAEIPFDFGPSFSRDGTRFLFLRGAPADCGKPDCGLMLMVADADGSNVRQLTPGPASLDWADWSPDGKQIAIDAAPPVGAGHVLMVVNADGSGSRTLDVGRPVHELSWLPPDGKEIVFRGERVTQTDPPVAIWAVNVATGVLRQLTTRPAHSDDDYQDVAVSPDGSRIAYQDDSLPAHEHILDLRTRQDRLLPGDGQFGGGFSPDGTKLVMLRGVAPGGRLRLTVATLDGSTAPIDIGPVVGYGDNGPMINNYTWSPDGSAILANYDLGKVALLMPIDGSKPIDLAHGDMAFPAYQRVAP